VRKPKLIGNVAITLARGILLLGQLIAVSIAFVHVFAVMVPPSENCQHKDRMT